MALDPILHLNLPPRSEAEAEADIRARYRRLDTAERLDDALVAARGLKLKLAAMHIYPIDPQQAAAFRRLGQKFLGGIDMADALIAVDDVIDAIEAARKREERS